MTINAGPEYFVAERRFKEAKTKEERIAALVEMIRLIPKHKSSENILRDLKKRLSKLRKEAASAAATTAKPKYTIRKEGAAQVCIVGLTKSGKSSLLNALTNARTEVADYPFTTKEPAVGMMDYEGVNIQLVEIPSTFASDAMSVVRTCDLVLLLLDRTKDMVKQLEELATLLEKNNMDSKKIFIVVNKCDEGSDENIYKTVLQVSAKTGDGLKKLKEEIWERLGLIRIYTKSPNGPKSVRPLTLKRGSNVNDAVEEVHKHMLKNFKFARVFNKTKFSGMKVGLDYVLSDLDVVEIHAG